LHGVDVSKADLSGAFVISDDGLEREARSLKGATLPDGTKHAWR